MSAFREILFPVDFSDQCKAVAPYIADFANRFQANLHLLHVIEGRDHPATLCGQPDDELKAFAACIPGATRWSQEVIHGDPADAIAHYAERRRVDLIAMPTSGKGRLRRWILGSTAESVLRRASCAVWTEAGTGTPQIHCSPVLCAIDLGPESEQVLTCAAHVAEQLDAHLIVVHAIPPIAEGLLMHPSDLPLALSHTEAQSALERLLQSMGLCAEAVPEMGTVIGAVSRVALQRRAKLLVIGRGGQKRERIGSHTYDLVASAPCPVLTCPDSRVSTHCFWTEWQQEGIEQPASEPIAGARR